MPQTCHPPSRDSSYPMKLKHILRCLSQNRNPDMFKYLNSYSVTYCLSHFLKLFVEMCIYYNAKTLSNILMDFTDVYIYITTTQSKMQNIFSTIVGYWCPFSVINTPIHQQKGILSLSISLVCSWNSYAIHSCAWLLILNFTSMRPSTFLYVSVICSLLFLQSILLYQYATIYPFSC